MKRLSQPQKPNPQKAKNRLLQAIQKNEPADWLIYEVLKDAAVTVGPVTIKIWPNFNQNLKEYADAWLQLTSKEGRKYIRAQLDVILNYIEDLINEQKKPEQAV